MSIVINYYNEKTLSLLKKYGPGPRIHYHMGIVRPELQIATDRALLQRQLTQSQEDMMTAAAAYWETPDLQGKRLLDVGAGLGGASLWMAMHKGAQVDSLVQFAEHANVIKSFAGLSGLSSQVTAHQGDAHTFVPPHGQRYDAIMAMESPCYFDRFAWFRHLDTILAPGGQIWLEDALLGPQPPADARPIFDAYWKTRVGDVPEYMAAAEAAGFVGQTLDITLQTSNFWRISAAWIEREMLVAQDKAKRARLQSSLDTALHHYDYWEKGHYRIALFHFQRAADIVA